VNISESPDCQTNISQPDNWINKSDHVQITCSVRHNGSWVPRFNCASGLPGPSIDDPPAAGGSLYRRVIAAADIADRAVLRCTMTFRLLDADHNSATSIPADSAIPHFDFPWNTSAIRVVGSNGKFCFSIESDFSRGGGGENR